MLAVTLILVSVSLAAAPADAIMMKFSRNNNQLYAETDENHFAIYQEAMDKSGFQISIVNSQSLHTLTHDCQVHSEPINSIGKNAWSEFSRIRSNFFKGWKRPIESPGRYTVSATFSAGESRHYYTKRIDDETIFYASKYLPSTIAKVIISSAPKVVVFVHYNGDVTMKSTNCLYDNERELVKGLQEIDVDKVPTWFSSPDKALKKYLKLSPVDELDFSQEQKFVKSGHSSNTYGTGYESMSGINRKFGFNQPILEGSLLAAMLDT